ncbi:uncharacterized protein LOC117903874 [Drosophila subobscura]|uniref:uncharacterized protein LOC117903874 n=1 Tax=Drosophila subobscura TaxID=7241 RepID=UPI00155B2E56|nr:uncharacterized protein LOC117903874 [Drosophila subobscura]
MAFMMPVMKNNYDIYKDTRSRKTSECSNASSNGTTAVGSALGTPTATTGNQQQQQRRRKVSECKSESFATSPSHGQLGGGGGSGGHRMQMPRTQSSRAFPRNASRSSNGSMMLIMSPTRSSPLSRTQTASALERQAAATAQSQNQNQQSRQQSNGNGSDVNASATASNDYTKFHLRLVDKLRKSFRKDNGKRS